MENTLKKEFNISSDLKDISFQNSVIKPYNFENKTNFGESTSSLYETDFRIFNIQFHLKMLVFAYETHNEILKLEIDILDKTLENELGYCRNFLQRKRNLNLVFEALIKFTEYVEARRLISKLVFEKPPILLDYDPDEGMVVTVLNNSNIIFFKAHWKLYWQVKDYSVVDVVEFYFDPSDTEFMKRTKHLMLNLTFPQLEFKVKFKLWKNLINEVCSLKNRSHKLGTELEIFRNSSRDSDILIVDDDNDEISIVEENASENTVSSTIINVEDEPDVID